MKDLSYFSHHGPVVQVVVVDLSRAACSHLNRTLSIGPTTDQRNHYCPDCGALWTTWPTDEERRVAARGVDSSRGGGR